MTFLLDERLQTDTLTLGQLKLCRVLLCNDARFPWLILVPQRVGISEPYQLTHLEQQQLWQESMAVAKLMEQQCLPDKINIGMLGNIVRQLHVHHVARTQNDECWPGPVWGQGVSRRYSNEEVKEQCSRWQIALTTLPDFIAG